MWTEGYERAMTPSENSAASRPSQVTEPAAAHRQRRLAIATIVVVGLLALVAVGVGLAAQTASRTSFDSSTPLEQRAASAARAHALLPWDAAYTRRSRLLSAWLLGKQQLARGDYNAAVETLGTAYRLDIGNPELLALYRKAQDTQTLATNRKAHLQHGHEGPGGTLRPQDIEN